MFRIYTSVTACGRLMPRVWAQSVLMNAPHLATQVVTSHMVERHFRPYNTPLQLAHMEDGSVSCYSISLKLHE